MELEDDELRRGSAAGAWNTTAFSAGSGVGPVQKMELKGSSPSSSAEQQGTRGLIIFDEVLIIAG